MKNFLFNRAAHYAGRKLDGHKTKIGGVGTIIAGLMMTLNGALQLIGSLYPDLGFEGTTPAAALEVMTLGIAGIGGGIGIIGLGHKEEKNAELIKQR